MLVVNNLIDLRSHQLFYVGKELNFRVKILVFEVKTSFVHFLENWIYLTLWAFLRKFNDLVCFKIPFDTVWRDFIPSPEFDKLFILVNSHWDHSIVRIEHNSKPFLEPEVAILRSSTWSYWDSVGGNKSEVFSEWKVLRFHRNLSLFNITKQIVIIFQNTAFNNSPFIVVICLTDDSDIIAFLEDD